MAKAAKTRTVVEAPLTPPRAALNRALNKAARDARRLADAFNVKIPAAPKSKG